MADSFGTINFTVLQAELGRGRQGAVTERHIPGGTVTYYDYAGLRALRFSYGLLLDEVSYLALEGTVGGTAALVSEVDGTISSAVLLDLSRTGRIPEAGTTFATAAFAVVIA